MGLIRDPNRVRGKRVDVSAFIAPTDGQTLVYNAATKTFESGTGGGGGGGGGALTFSNIAATRTSSTATITWDTDIPSDSQVAYGTTPAYGSVSALDPAMVTHHSVTVSGLLSDTTYYFVVRSKVPVDSGQAQFATQPLPSGSGVGPASYANVVMFSGALSPGDFPVQFRVTNTGSTTFDGPLVQCKPGLSVLDGSWGGALGPGATYTSPAIAAGECASNDIQFLMAGQNGSYNWAILKA